MDSTQVTMEKSEDPFKYFGLAIVGNIVSYSSFSDEDEEKTQSQQKDERLSTKSLVEDIRVSTETTTTSAPHTTIIPSIPSTLVVTVQSDDEAEVQNLMSSLSKLFEKKKSVK